MLALFSEPQEDNSFESLHLHIDPERVGDDGSKRSVIDIQVQPHDEATVLLGIFDAEKAPKGYSIALSPEPETAEPVIAQVTSAELDRKHQFMLYVKNLTNQVLTAEARPI